MKKNNFPDVKAILFDMDGVIVDSPAHWLDVTSEFFSKFMSNWSRSYALELAGIDLRDMYSHLIHNWKIDMTREEFISWTNRAAQVVYQERVCLCPGLLELLESANHKQVKVALASSAPLSWIAMVLERFSIERILSIYCFC